MRHTSKWKKMITQVIIQRRRWRTNSKWLNIKEVHANEVSDDTSPILYKVRLNDQPVTALFNTGASVSVISTTLFDSLKHNPKILQCSRALRGTGGEALIPKGEYFLQTEIGKQILRDWVLIINSLNHGYIIGAAMQRSHCMSTFFSIMGRHFLSVNGQMVVQSITTPTMESIIKTKGKINLNPHSITIVSVKTPPNVDTSHVYELNHKFLY